MTRAVDPWIELHVGLAQHPKLIKLQARLSLDKPTAIGHLSLLWTWAMQYATDGRLKRFSDAELAIAAQYDARNGTPAAFVEALLVAGWIDPKTRKLHDWDLYAGRMIERRSRDTERMRAYRSRTSRERSRHVQGDPTGPTNNPPTPRDATRTAARDAAPRAPSRWRREEPALSPQPPPYSPPDGEPMTDADREAAAAKLREARSRISARKP